MEGRSQSVFAGVWDLAALEPPGGLVRIGRQIGPGAAMNGRADDLVDRVVVWRFGVLPDQESGESASAAKVLRDRGVGQAHLVERHVGLAHVVPLGPVRQG